MILRHTDKQGILTPTTKAALEKAEAARATLIQMVQGPQGNDAKVAAFLPYAIGRFKTLIDDLANVTQAPGRSSVRPAANDAGEGDRAPSDGGWGRTLPDSGSDGGLCRITAAGDG